MLKEHYATSRLDASLGGGTLSAPIPTSPTGEANDTLDALLQEAHHALTTLYDRLQPAVLNSGVQQGDARKTPLESPAQPWVLARTVQQCQQVRELIARIEDMRNRLVI